MIIKHKERADGWCGVCGKPVPKDNSNLFYCSYYCCDIAYCYFHPPKEEEEGTYGRLR